MTWIDSRSYADKVVKLLSDNRALPSEWKYSIPILIVQQPITVVINAKHLADGINEAIDLYHPDAAFYSLNPDKYIQESLF